MNYIQSMTGFSRIQIENEFGLFIWELRTLNHRYYDVSISLPSTLRFLEGDIRTEISHTIKRGRVDAHLKFLPSQNLLVEPMVNHALIGALDKVKKEMTKLIEATPPSMDVLLNWPGLVEYNPVDFKMVQPTVILCLANALKKLTEERKREGVLLQQYAMDRVATLNEILKEVHLLDTDRISQYREGLKRKVNELIGLVDTNRLEQEVVFYAQKIDISEEMHRFEVHLKELEKTLLTGGVVGRRLDFILQELNREANTIASKSLQAKIAQLMIDTKVILEQIREQIQNVE